METDFLNFHDEEHFSVLGSESPQFEDRSSLIDSYSHYAFSRHSSLDYVDSTSSYFEDEEQEINGDIAVIPVSGQLVTQFPHLSSSPDCKDDFISEWHHFGAIECPEKEELNLLSPEILDDVKPTNLFIYNSSNQDVKPNVNELKLNLSNKLHDENECMEEKNDINEMSQGDLPHLNNSLKDLVDIENTENDLLFVNVNSSFDLIPSAVKKEIGLDIDLQEPFDLASFINDDDNVVDPLFNGESEKGLFIGESEKEEPAVKVKQEPQDIVDDNVDENWDIDNEDIDVETVSPGEQHPILEAGDVTSLLEQFEANEANATKTYNAVESYPSKQNLKKKVSTKLVNVEQKEKDVVEKIKANRKRKSISVIPAMPNVKMPREKKTTIKKPVPPSPKPNNIVLAQQEFVHLDHDYCCSPQVPSRINKNFEKARKGTLTNIDNSLANIKINSRNIDVLRYPSDQITKNIENTALRIQDTTPNCQPKTNTVPVRISKASNPPVSILKMQNTNQKSLIFKNGQNIIFNSNTPPIKSGKNGKLMVSVLKTNVKNNLINQNLNNINSNTVIETKSQDKAIQNITITTPVGKDEGIKKRKLNLEEYKRRREIKSCGTSRTNSPSELADSGNLSPVVERNSSSLPVTAVGSPQPATSTEETKKLTPQELLLKMAADLLTTPAKSLKTPAYTIIPFTLPPEETPVKSATVEVSETLPPKPTPKNYEMRTIVSIGVNTTVTMATENDSKLSNNKETNLPKVLSDKIIEDEKLKEIITPILQNASTKINSNSLISNITETILQKHNKPKKTPPKNVEEKIPSKDDETKAPLEHGEDKTIIVLDKNRIKPTVVDAQTQTESILESVETLIKPKPQYRHRTNSSSSISSTDSEISRKNSSRKMSSDSSGRESVQSTSSTSRYSRSRSRSISPPLSRSSYSSYSSSSSRSRTRSRSRSSHRRRSLSRKYSRSRYSSRNRSSYSSYLSYRRSKSPRSKERKKRSRESIEREKRQVNERRVIYVGNLESGTTRKQLMYRFGKFGPIIEIKIHERSREKGGNYGFVTFQRQNDAYEAIEKGNDDPTLPKYDISFGGRRVFCGTHYSDLDNSEAIIMSSYSRSAQEDSFDILLKEVQAKLRKRKV